MVNSPPSSTHMWTFTEWCNHPISDVPTTLYAYDNPSTGHTFSSDDEDETEANEPHATNPETIKCIIEADSTGDAIQLLCQGVVNGTYDAIRSFTVVNGEDDGRYYVQVDNPCHQYKDRMEELQVQFSQEIN